MNKFHVSMAFAFSVLLAGCTKSTEDKMTAICTDIAKFSVSDPSLLVVNAGSSKVRQATEKSVTRFAVMRSNGKLDSDQQAALDIHLSEMHKMKEAYAEIDFTDKSAAARRANATCWFMDIGQGFELASASVGDKSYSGIDLTALFIEYDKPELLDSSNKIN